MAQKVLCVVEINLRLSRTLLLGKTLDGTFLTKVTYNN